MLGRAAAPSLDDVIVAAVPWKPSTASTSDWAEACVRLTQSLATEPHSVAQRLAETAMELTGAESAGISLEEPDAGIFRWVATAGEFSRYLDGTMPRDFSPCGAVLDRGEALMMRDPARVFPYIAQFHAPVRTVLLAPFSANSRLVGTVWVIAHDSDKDFSTQDLRFISDLAAVASSLSETAGLLTKLTRKEQEGREQLATTESARLLLSSFFQQAPGFFASLRGPEYVFELVNESYMKLVGTRDLVGKPVFEALPELRGQGLEDLLKRVYRTGEPFVGRGMKIDVRGPTGAAETRYIDFVYQPTFDSHKAVVGIFVQGHDITDQHVTAQKLAEADESKDRFLAMVSHELRNPLSPILLATDVLRSNQASLDIDQRCALSVIENQAAVLTRLVNDLLDLSRVRSGKLRVQPVRMDVRDAAVAAVEMSKPILTAKMQPLEVSLGKQPAYVHGDSTRLCQVVFNLINNASKFSPAGNTIRLSLDVTDGWTRLQVADDGLGIAPEFLPCVFDIYAQAPTSTVHAQDGLGLGLALVKQIVEMHGGIITANSEGLGKGARFTVALPVPVAPQE